MSATRTKSPARRQDAPPTPAHAPAPGRELRAVFERALGRIQQAMPSHLSAERMLQVVTTVVYRTPKLQQCDPSSVLAAAMQAAALGLDLAPGMNEAFLIPRYNKQAGVNECQFQIGYQGLVKLARQAGQVAVIQARVVRQGDVFEYGYDPELYFRHVPSPSGEGEVTHAYGYAKLANGERLIEVMTAAEVQAIRRRSQSADHGPWVTDWNEMARKTVLKRLCKALPRSIELAEAVTLDDREYEAGASIVSGPPPGALGRPRASALADRLAGRQLDAPEGPAFDAGEGVERPLRSEAPDDDLGPDGTPYEPDPDDAEIDAQAARDAGRN